jgi:glutamate dehydrogenase/leucine dehydrogenase
VLVQGAGSVGHDLALFLAMEGAQVLVSDIDGERAAATGGTVVASSDALTTECDVYAPCAVGGTLSATSIPHLRCRIVAGSANNQLAAPEDAERLHDRGILYAPDYVINAGGVIQLLGLEDHGWDEHELDRNLATIGDTLRELFRTAAEDGITPAAAAERVAAERIAKRRAEALA